MNNRWYGVSLASCCGALAFGLVACGLNTAALTAGTLGTDAKSAVDGAAPGAGEKLAGRTDGGGAQAMPVALEPTIEEVLLSDSVAGAFDVTLRIVGRGLAKGAVVAFHDQVFTTKGEGNELVVGPLVLPLVGNAYPVEVRNPDGKLAKSFVTVFNPKVQITEVLASSLLMGSTGVSVTLKGTNFVYGGLASFAGKTYPLVGVGDVRTFGPLPLPNEGGAFAFEVTNPSPTVGTTQAVLNVQWPAATVTGATLSSRIAGTSGVTLTVTGAHFHPGVRIQLPTGFSPSGDVEPTSQSSTMLTLTGITLPASSGNYTLSVRNASPTAEPTATAMVALLSNGNAIPGLVAYYPFEDSSEDASGRGNHLSLAGSPSYSVGKFGKGLQLNGTQSAATEANPMNFDFGSFEFSISCWVKHAGGGTLVRGNTQYNLALENGRLSFWFAQCSPDACWHPVNGMLQMNLGTWHHVAVTFGTSNPHLYVDGAEDATVGPLLYAPPSHGPITLGSGLVGQLDEVRFYNRALTPLEVQSLAAP